MERKITLSVEPEVKELGIKPRLLRFRVPSISQKPPKTFRRMAADELSKQNPDLIEQSFTVHESELLQMEAGIDDFSSPARGLWESYKKEGRLRNTNAIVDIYNFVSVTSGLSLGAHDIDHIVGNVRFKLADGTESFTPLTREEPKQEPVGKSEYLFVDDKKVLCRMDLKQGNETAITRDTRDFVIVVQGNSVTPDEVIEEVCTRIKKLISEYCQGSEYLGEITQI